MEDGVEDDVADTDVNVNLKNTCLPGLDFSSEKLSIIPIIPPLLVRHDSILAETDFESNESNGFDIPPITKTYSKITEQKKYENGSNKEVNVKMLSEIIKNVAKDYGDLQEISGISTLLNFTGLTENQSFYISDLTLEPTNDNTETKFPQNDEEKINNDKPPENEKRQKRDYRQCFSPFDAENEVSDGDFSPTDGSDYDPNDDISNRKRKRSKKLDFTEISAPRNEKELMDDIKLPEKDSDKGPRSRTTTRVWDRKNCCVYCDQLVTNFSRHITRKHSKEKEVLEYISITDTDKNKLKLRRQKITDELRNRGNFKHNSRVAFNREGDLLPRKRNTSATNSPSNFVTCKRCLGTFKRSTFYRHFKNCGDQECDLPNTNQRRVVRNHSISIVPDLETASKELQENILPRLRLDDVSLIVKTDPLILAFGSRLLKKKKERRSRKSICSRMRDLAMLLTITREKDKDIDTLTSIIEPSKYEIFIEAVKSMSGFNEETGFVKVISIPARIRPAILGCIDILYTQTIMSDHSSAYKDAYKQKLEDFKRLLEINWQWEISSNAEKTRKRLHMTKENVLPLDEDIETITKKIHMLEDKYSRKLKKDINVINYEDLCVVTIAHIILLDRKRAGDAAEAELTFYINRKNEELPEKILQSLTSNQRQCIDELDVFQIPGKRTRSVPILITKKMRENIDLIISCRSVLNISHTNPYLFARPLTKEPFDGGKCLDKIKKMCNLKKPQMLTSTGMRHHIATMSQIDSKHNDHYTEQLAGFLGHDMAVHSKNYRLPLQVLQKAVVGSKLIEYEKSGNSYERKYEKLKESTRCNRAIPNETITSKHLEQGITAPINEEEKEVSLPVKYLKQVAEERNRKNYEQTEDTMSLNTIEVDGQNAQVIISNNSTEESQKREYENEKGGKNIPESVVIESNQQCNNQSDTEDESAKIETRPTLKKKIERKTYNFKTRQCNMEKFSDNTDEEKSEHYETETDSSNESEGVPEKKTCRRKTAHVKWTEQEIKLVKKHFKINIEKRINPGKAKCTEVLKKEPILRKRTWMQLNTYVNNIYKKKKR